jgi:2-polyprenyl-3-methyl-5-hydroxy-6-metoxy-1,4-benzoquinol methylase
MGRSQSGSSDLTNENPVNRSYDTYADAYAVAVAEREAGGIDGDPFGLLRPLLELLGDVAGRQVLDAGCGNGYLARVLAAHGARVTGIDIEPRLIASARHQDPDSIIEYWVADLSQPLPSDVGRFDAVASYLVLNDVPDYRGFVATLASLLRPGGRLVLAFNNPYGAVIHGHVRNYFDSGASSPYRGQWAVGIKTYLHHRTLENYLDAFLDTGLQLTKLVDSPALASLDGRETGLPDGTYFPRFMLLAFSQPSRDS